MSDADLIQEVREKLAKSGLPDELEYDGTLTIFAGRAHVAYVSNHQSGERGRAVAQFLAAAPRLVRSLLERCVALTEERDALARLQDEMIGTLLQHQTEVARLRAERAWQPISTAPKDGSPILGYMPTYYQGKGGQSVILWLDGAWHDNRAWETDPTHWQPLAAPPEIRAERAKEEG